MSTALAWSEGVGACALGIERALASLTTPGRFHMRPQTMAAAFASVQLSIENCQTHSNVEWLPRWRTRLAKLVELIPSGSGIDSGPHNVRVSQREIAFEIGFHHMSDDGYYDGWTEHTIRVRPAFEGLDITISGRDRNDVKDQLHEIMEYAFTRHVTWNEDSQRWTVESDDERYAAMARAYPEVK